MDDIWTLMQELAMRDNSDPQGDYQDFLTQYQHGLNHGAGEGEDLMMQMLQMLPSSRKEGMASATPTPYIDNMQSRRPSASLLRSLLGRDRGN